MNIKINKLELLASTLAVAMCSDEWPDNRGIYESRLFELLEELGYVEYTDCWVLKEH